MSEYVRMLQRIGDMPLPEPPTKEKSGPRGLMGNLTDLRIKGVDTAQGSPVEAPVEYGGSMERIGDLGRARHADGVLVAAARTNPNDPPSALPPSRSEFGLVDPHSLIRNSQYQDPYVAEEMGRRLGSEWTTLPTDDRYVSLIARNSDHVGRPGVLGTHQASKSDDRIIDVAARGLHPRETLIHEARHAITPVDGLLGSTPIEGIVAAPGRMLPQANDTLRRAVDSSRIYGSPGPLIVALRDPDVQKLSQYIEIVSPTGSGVSNPAEVLAYTAEAGDKFVREHGRPIRTIRDVNEALEAWASDPYDKASSVQQETRDILANSYAHDEDTRELIRHLLRFGYYAVPPAVAASSTANEDKKQSPLGGLLEAR